MQQLPGLDAVFLAMETPTTHSHIGGVTILDPQRGQGFDFERFRQVVGERLTYCPRFTWKVQEVPLGLDLPYWVEDEDFDLAHHVRRIAVPSPGGLPELMDLAGFLHSQPLDRDRPLWEAWLIEGLEGGRSGLYIKTHHCLMDGQSGVGLADLLCDLQPDAEKPILPTDALANQEERAGEPVGILEMTERGLRNARRRPGLLAGHLKRFGAAALESLREPETRPTGPTPRLGLNGRVGRQRSVAMTSVCLDEVKAVKKHFDVTVNDVVLALTGSALRRYLEERDELPEDSLVALVPMSTREEGDETLGNQISQINVPWATHLEDPGARLLEIARNTRRAKERGRRSGANLMGALGEALPPGMVSLFSRLGGVASESTPLPGNAVVSNVRATPVPLYIAGARVERMVPMSLLAPGQGLNFTAVSYCGEVHFGVLADPGLVPDCWRLADAIPHALDELRAAAEERVRRAS